MYVPYFLCQQPMLSVYGPSLVPTTMKDFLQLEIQVATEMVIALTQS